MAWFLAFDGVNDRVPLTDYTIQTNDSIKARVVHKTSSGDRFIFSGFISGNAGRWQVETFSNKWFVRLGATSSGTSIAPMLTDGQAYDIELKRTGTLWEFIVDGSTIYSLTTSFTPLPLDAIGASGGGSFFAKIELEYLTTNTRNYSAAASTKGAGSTILNDIGVDNLDATGIGFPTDGSQWINTGAALDITPSSIGSVSTGNNPAITFNSVVNVSPLSINSSSAALNPSVVFNSVLNLAPQSIDSVSDSINPTISFSSLLQISPQTIDSVSLSIDPVVAFTSALNINPQSIDSLSTTINPVIAYKSIINVLPQSVDSLSISLNPLITTGQVQQIGNVTASFKDSGISVKYEEDEIIVGYKPNVITVNFK